MYFLLTQPILGTWHILSHSILSTILRCWNYYSHFKDEKPMSRNQHAEDCLIRKWKSQNWNKTILFFSFLSDTTLFISRQRFCKHLTGGYKVNNLKNHVGLSVVYVCEVHVLKCLSEHDTWICSMLEFCDVSEFAEVRIDVKGKHSKITLWIHFFLYGLLISFF